MRTSAGSDVYSAREIALAAGVSENEAASFFDSRTRFVSYGEALRIARDLRPRRSIFFVHDRPPTRRGVPLALSSSLHLGLIAIAGLVTTWIGAPAATALMADSPAEPVRLIFLAQPGPGGGGGGGGRLEKAPPPKAMREGRHKVRLPLPVRVPPPAAVATAAPKEPKPVPLAAEPLPVVVAPIVASPADSKDRIGALIETPADVNSHGPGKGGGVGSGTGAGIGPGDGAGVGPGSGGGTGGGPYRPGSGIEPPRVIREIKADYTEEAVRRAITGEVVMEITVRRDGSVGDVRILQGLPGGLNDRAVQAVRQWKFVPARRQGTAVDVLVEVAVEFKLR